MSSSSSKDVASLARITRQPGSTIQFASFDPATATGDQSNAAAFKKLSLNEELCRPKRIVIETTSEGRCTWRFVPNARWEPGVENEGAWPRVVDVCGELMTITHDQWDVFKLDRDYACLVRPPPLYSSVMRVAGPSSPGQPIKVEEEEFPVKLEEEEPSLDVRQARSKRRLSDGAFARRLSGSNPDGQRKKKKRIAATGAISFSSDEEESDGADEHEVNKMIIDGEAAPKRPQFSERLRKVREIHEEARRKRREAFMKRNKKAGMNDDADDDEGVDDMSWTDIPLAPPTPIPMPRHMPTEPPSSPTKRKVEIHSEENDGFEENPSVFRSRFKPYEKAGTSKRIRTVSPSEARRSVVTSKNRRENNRKEELERRTKARSHAMHGHAMKELFEEAARSQPTPQSTQASYGPSIFESQTFGAAASGTQSQRPDATQDSGASSSSTQTPEPSVQQEAMDEEAQRQAALEESKRKIAELEKDRHLWEAEARKRTVREAEEKARAEAARKAQAASEAASSEKEKAKAARSAAENQQRARDAAAAEMRTKRMHARDAAKREARAWISRGWSGRRALERYTALCEAFDSANFMKGDVILFETIPWPVLMRPGSFGVEDIDWTAVESFFRQVRQYLSTTDFVKLVEKSHKRFHPDRWRSRRVLQSVDDEEEKECLETAANTVAQALTPLWQEATGR